MATNLDQIDLEQLADALDDHTDSYDGLWMFDPRTGETGYYSSDAGDFDDADEDLDPALIRVDPLPGSVGYADMADFVDRITQRRPAEMLARAIEGRAAFRRFRDTLREFPQVQQQWYSFRDARLRSHALEWIADNGLIAAEVIRQAQRDNIDPPVGGATATLAHQVAHDLRKLYGPRLVQVVMYGSRARGDHDEESDLDLLVVLDRVDDWSAERDFMDEIIWRHTYASDILVSAQPVSAERYDHGESAFLRNVRADGVAA